MKKFEDLLTDILERLGKIEEMLDKMSKEKSVFEGETLLDNQDLCELLGVAKRTVARYRQKGLISYYTVDGRKSYYRSSDVAKMLKLVNQDENKEDDDS